MNVTKKNPFISHQQWSIINEQIFLSLSLTRLFKVYQQIGWCSADSFTEIRSHKSSCLSTFVLKRKETKKTCILIQSYCSFLIILRSLPPLCEEIVRDEISIVQERERGWQQHTMLAKISWNCDALWGEGLREFK